MEEQNKTITTISIYKTTKERLNKLRAKYKKKIGFDKLFNEILDYFQQEGINPE